MLILDWPRITGLTLSPNQERRSRTRKIRSRRKLTLNPKRKEKAGQKLKFLLSSCCYHSNWQHFSLLKVKLLIQYHERKYTYIHSVCVRVCARARVMKNRVLIRYRMHTFSQHNDVRFFFGGGFISYILLPLLTAFLPLVFVACIFILICCFLGHIQIHRYTIYISAIYIKMRFSNWHIL